jgi:flagellar hook-associated protein 3 FlgL
MPSSVQIYSQAIADFKRLQDTLFEKQSKISADSKASTFAELGDDINIVQGLTLSINRSNRFITSVNEALRRNDTLYQSIGQIIAQAQAFQANLTIENSASANVNDLTTIANATLDIIRDALNAKDGSNYIFSGSKTTQQPVDDLKISSNFFGGEATASYYNGDDFKLSVDVSASLRVEYGVTAADDSFKNLIGAINLAKEQEANGAAANYDEVGPLLDTAIEELIALQASIGDHARIFENTLSYQETAKATFEQKYSEINSPDIITLTVEATQAQATLEASFSAFSRITQTSLINYL